MVPIPWTTLWRYKGALPIILVMMFAFFAIGAEVGAEAAMAGNESAKAVWNVNETELDRAAVEVAREEADGSMFTEDAWGLMAQLVFVPLVQLVADGFFWGYEHPAVGQYMLELANLLMLATVLGYLYVTYRSVKWVFRW